MYVSLRDVGGGGLGGGCLCVVFGLLYFLELWHPSHSGVGGSCPRRSRYDPCCSGVKTVFHMYHISPMLGEIAPGAGWCGSCRGLRWQGLITVG